MTTIKGKLNDEEAIRVAKWLYQNKPFVTKLWIAVQIKRNIEFVKQHWSEITS